jgi:hypothetical protein
VRPATSCGLIRQLSAANDNQAASGSYVRPEVQGGGVIRLRPPLFPGRVLLSRVTYGHSTIGAGGLNCRVRDGNGCFTSAMTTGIFAPPC